MRPSKNDAGGTASVATTMSTRTESPKDTDTKLSVSISRHAEEWTPQKNQTETRSKENGAAPGEHNQAPPVLEPASPRMPSKRYPVEVRAAVKSLRKSLFEALKKKRQLNGFHYVRNLLINAETYAPPAPKPRPILHATRDDKDPKPGGDDGTIEEEHEASPGQLSKTEMRYEADGVKPHTRTQRSSQNPGMRMVPVDSPTTRKDTKTSKETSTAAKEQQKVESGETPKRSSKYKLPPKWEIKESRFRTREYYYNTETGESTWRHPGAPTDAPIEDDEVTHVKALAIVDVLHKDLGMHVFKRELRPLLEFGGISDGESLMVEPLLDALNEDCWWPAEEQIIKDTLEEFSKVREELQLSLGQKLADAMTDGQDIDYVRNLLDQVQNDRSAVEELKTFLSISECSMNDAGSSNSLQSESKEDKMDSDAVDKESFEDVDALSQQNRQGIASGESKNDNPSSETKGENKADAKLPSIDPFSVDPMRQTKVKKKGITPFLARITKPIVPKVSAKPPAVKKSFLDNTIPPPKHMPARDPEVEWRPWINPKTGKLHEPIPVPSPSRGSSRGRAAEYAKQLGDNTFGARFQRQEDYNSFWRRSPSPSGPRVVANEYRRWHEMAEPVPGFSPHSTIHSEPPKTPWFEQKIEIPFKMGSRFTQRIGGLQPERETCISLLTGNLKEERKRSNLVLDGQKALKTVRTFVQQDAFDRAVKVADEALQKFKQAGKNGSVYAKEIGTADDYVISIIKGEIDRLVAFTHDGIQRSLCDKASQQIPKLRKASSWLMAKGVVYPEARQATTWETRHGISTETFPEGLGVIDNMMEDIVKKASSVSLSCVSSSLSKYFSAMRPELDLEDKSTFELVEDAAGRRNQLPEEIITDGRTFICVFDLKSPDLPEQLKITQRVAVRGERSLASGSVCDGTEWMSGTISSFNKRARKYKVQYENDYEWITWPLSGAVELELDVYPEEVVITAKGYHVRSITQEHPQFGRKVAIVAFNFVPLGGDCSVYGVADVSVKGVKANKSLLVEGESAKVLIIPPEFLRPATRYEVYDCLSKEPLTSAIVEFVRQTDEEKFEFACGQPVELEDGVYVMEVRGNNKSGYPWTSQYSLCVLTNGRKRAPENDLSRVFLNRHIHAPEELRIVLTWGAKPLRLDQHLYTSEGGHMQFTDAGRVSHGVKIEMDASTGFGPETATVKINPSLGYSFSVFWAGDGGSSQDWTDSLASVTLYDTTGPFAVFHSPPPRLDAKEDKWWHVFGLDGSLWKSPGKGIVRVNQRMPNELPELALQGWTLVDSLRKGMWDDFCSLLETTMMGSGGRSKTQPCMAAKRLALMTSLEGSTLLSLLCAQNYDLSVGDDPLASDETGETILQKQIKALRLLMKSTVKLEKAAKSLAAMDGGIPHDLALEKEIRMRGVRDTYIFRAVMHASSEVAVHILSIMTPVLKRASMSAPIRHFFYEHGEDLLEICIVKRKPNHLIPVLQALLAIEAVWERKPIRRFLVGDRVSFEWPYHSGNWVQGVVHECRYDVNVIRLDADVDLVATNTVHSGCQSDPSDSGIIHDTLLGDKLVRISPSRLKWTSRALVLLKSLAERHQKEARQVQIGAAGPTIAQKQTLVAAEVYKRAVKIMAEKAFVELDKDDKKKSNLPNASAGKVEPNED